MTPPSSPAPSRSLDAEIAERVMGDDLGHVHQWVHHTTLDDGYGASDGWYCAICYPKGYEGVLMLSDPRNDPRTYEVRPKPRPYSSDISAAWTVVEKLRERRIGETELRQVFSLAHCYTAEQVAAAICRAALAAVAPPRAPLEGE